MPIIYLSLGTNLGDRIYNLQQALDGMQPHIQIDSVSAVYETEPWGPIQEQPNYYNICVAGRTEIEPEALLSLLKKLENQIGRQPGDRWGPRLIDIDLLFYDELVWESLRLRLPHRQIADRAFVLVPLVEIAPDFVHPETGLSVSDMVSQIDIAGVDQVPGLQLLPTGEAAGPPTEELR